MSTGPTGRNGAIGPRGLQGFTGTTGPRGLQGVAGPIGLQGATGLRGLQGTTGSRGLQGVAGPQGLQGATGSIGLQGVAGSRGLQGVAGSRGLQGVAGLQGLQGFTGATGPLGLQGVAGLPGIQGVAGPIGLQGATGSTGLRGLQGVAGPQGLQGVAGPIGLQGVAGSRGLQGVAGSRGLQGVAGPQGLQGFTGATGIRGLQGVAGPIGLQGFTGANGSVGLQGIAGPQGLQGVAGPIGLQGATGSTGLRGLQGVVGSTGPIGLQGINGTNGTNGSIGETGPIGPTGTFGISPTFEGTVSISDFTGDGVVHNNSNGVLSSSLIVSSDIDSNISLESPDLTGTPTATTPDDGDNSARIATTAFVISSVSAVSKTSIELGNVDNTSDVSKPISTAQQSALNLKAPLESPIFTGSVSISDFSGDGVVHNNSNGVLSSSLIVSSDIDSNISLESPDLTGTPTATTPDDGDNSTRIATTAFVISSVSAVSKTSIELGNVDNTSDVSKPISTAQQSALNLKAPLESPTFTGSVSAPTPLSTSNTTDVATTEFVKTQIGELINGAPDALNTLKELSAAIGDNSDYAASITTSLSLKAPLASPTFTGTIGGITKAMVGLSNVDNTSDVSKPISTDQQTALDLKAPLASPTFTGTVGGITKGMIGLSNVDNTSDVSKPISTAQQTALDLKAPLANPTFTGTVGGITKGMIGLSNVDNTSDVSKPISTDQQTALDLKAPLESPTLTGLPTAPTQSSGDNTTRIATTAFVTSAVSAVAVSSKSSIGLGNVDNTSDVSKPISTAQQTALDLKAPLESPALTSPTLTNPTLINASINNINLIPNQTVSTLNGTYISRFGQSVSLSRNGLMLAVGANSSNNGEGYVKIYEFVSGNWSQKGSTLNGVDHPSTTLSREFGISVSLSNDGLILAVGAFGTNVNKGSVYIYEFVSGNWSQKGSTLNGISNGDLFGWSVSLSGNGLFLDVGAIGANNYNGSVYRYEFVSGGWSQRGGFIGGQATSEFGRSLSLSSDGLILAIGAPAGNSDTGYVQLAEYSTINQNWSSKGSTIHGTSGSLFGKNVSLSDNGLIVAVGAPAANSRTGYVNIYEFVNGNWSQKGSTLNGTAIDNEFGKGVSLSSNGLILAVGVPGGDLYFGYVNIYEFVSGNWSQKGSKLNGTDGGGQFGDRVSLSSNGLTLAGGASTADNMNGAVKIYSIEQSPEFPSSPVVGQMFFSSDTNRLYIYNGSIWKYVSLI